MKTTNKIRSFVPKFLKSKRFWNWTVRIIALFLAFVAFLFIWYSRDLPDPNKLLARSVPQSTKIYSRDGVLLYEVHGEFKRTLIPYSEMNSYIKDATIAVEDKDFYNEGGINVKGIFRSILADLKAGGKVQGASTITQQFVKNAVLTDDKSFTRKIKEIILSLEINKRFSKDDVLKLYLNEIPYGRNAYGIEAAAQTYFNKHARDLDLAEAAYLAALPQAPSYYNPDGPNREALENRKNIILSLMKDQGYIDQQQYDQAKAEKVTFQKATDQIQAPHFVFYIENYLTEKYGENALESGGYTVTTTLDSKMQADAEQAVTDNIKNVQAHKGNNAALVAVDPKTGQILAMVGSKDFFGDPEPKGCTPGVNCTFEPQVNVALAERQPGSSMKPYVYVTAFKPNLPNGQAPASPATLRVDVKTNFGTFGGKPYIPSNYTGQDYGPVSIRQALAGSLNVPAVKTLDLVGPNNAIQTMRDVGIQSPLKDCGLTLVLGGCEVNLLEHVSGYSAFATEGTYHPVTGILKIEDSAGNTVEQFQDQPKQVIDPQSVYELISIMTDNNARQFIFGSSSKYLVLPDRPVAAKTGTTQNNRDGWTLGFTPSLTAGVWTGNNDGSFMNTDAVITAGPIWHEFMLKATADMPVEDFPVPDGVQHLTVDALSGMLPGPYTTQTKDEVFASFSAPTQQDTMHVAFDQVQQQQSIQMPTDQVTPIDPNNPNPQPFTQNPQTQTVVTRSVCIVLHSERPDDPNWENPVIAWAQGHPGYCYPPAGSIPVTSPNNPPPTSTTPQGNPPAVNIIAPSNNTTIDNVPFILQANAVPDQGNQISRVDLLIDGAIVDSKTSAPYTFTINQMLSPGAHTFAVHGVDNQNNSADDSIELNFK